VTGVFSKPRLIRGETSQGWPELQDQTYEDNREITFPADPRSGFGIRRDQATLLIAPLPWLRWRFRVDCVWASATEGIMCRRFLLALLLSSLSLSLSNSVLLIGQLVAWSNMTQERTDAMGLGSAVLSSLEGEDLCELCFVIRDENRKQSEPGTAKESSAIAKTLVLAYEMGDLFPAEPLARFLELSWGRSEIPLGRSEEVAMAPPRFEV